MALSRARYWLFICLFAGLALASHLSDHGKPTTSLDLLSPEQLDEELQVSAQAYVFQLKSINHKLR
jgi:hypothetical protein